MTQRSKGSAWLATSSRSLRRRTEACGLTLLAQRQRSMKLVNLLTSTIDTIRPLGEAGPGLKDVASAAMNTFKGVTSGDVSRIVSATKDLKSAKDNLIGAVAGEGGVKAFDSGIKSLFQGDIGGATRD